MMEGHYDSLPKLCLEQAAKGCHEGNRMAKAAEEFPPRLVVQFF